ncbi:MAG: hypothetical protein H6668_01830 [Ardenticatenaceae bacterium]|nr:hypothetical protein [Ardenticatenaceae bacterium]
MNRQTTTTAYLLVEGNDDQHVVWALCKEHNLPDNFVVRTPKAMGATADNVNSLLTVFATQLLADDQTAVGLILDADQQNRWQQFQSHVRQANLGYQLPAQPDPAGTIIPSPDGYAPRIGVWIMPDNTNPGALEEFVNQMMIRNAHGKEPLEPFANKILDELEQARLNRYGHKRSKAFVRTWLAWQEQPGLPMGQAIGRGFLSAHTPLATAFVRWLNRLFNP